MDSSPSQLSQAGTSGIHRVPQPSLPLPRGRSSGRYPASLAVGEPGRVPLHRRGTSKTYERLEDLLREAGYKETRVFTPESERAEAQAAERKRRESIQADRGNMRDSVGAVVEFLAGWIPGSSKGGRMPNERRLDDSRVRHDADSRSRENSPSPSPRGPLAQNLASDHLQPKRDTVHKPYSPSLCASSATIASIPSSLSLGSSDDRALSLHRPRRQQRQPNVHPSGPLLRPQSSASVSLRTYAQVSAAQGYLRHMASTPTIHKHGRASTRDNSSERLNANAHRNIPSLPSAWLDTVTKAVLGSSEAGVHVGGPHTSRSSTRSGWSLRHSKNMLVDQTNYTRSISGASPGFTTYLRRAEMAPSTVSTARVMCRSAPASRSSSRTGDRNHPRSRDGSVRSLRWGERSTRPKRSNGRRDGVPVLLTTDIENDAWSMQWVDGQRVYVTGPQDSASHEHASDGGDLDSDDDDAEPNFAQLLVNPKRQYSIQSLRRHLHRAPRAEPTIRIEPWEDEGDHRSTAARAASGYSRRGSMDDGDGSDYLRRWEALGVPGFDRTAPKRRRALPNSWASLTRGGGSNS